MFELKLRNKTTMKKKLLLVTLLFSAYSNSQSLTSSNEPGIGETGMMYECESSFSNFSSLNGTGVVWDFSNLKPTIGNASKTISVLTPDTNCYSSATKMTKIPNFISSYWGSTSNDKTSYGFKFHEATSGDIIVKFNVDPEKVMNYPFSVTNSFTDTYSGTCYNKTLTNSQESVCTGSISASIDGQGTLILAGPTTFTNVIRHKVEEISNTSFVYGILTIPATITRTQFDYYNTSGTSKLPIFSHVTISIQATGVNKNISLVLSSVNPFGVGLTENQITNFSVYPNPTQGNVSLLGDFSENASAVVIDQTGRVVGAIENVINGSTIDLSNVEKGIYFVVISNNELKTTKTIMLR